MIASILRAAILSVALSASAAAAFAASAPSDLGGVWRTAQGDGLVTFKSCGGALCGYLVETAADTAPSRTLLIDGLMRVDQVWSGGRIVDPRSGRSYSGEVRSLGDGRIRVTGCLVRPLCGSQVWNRVR